MNALYLVLPLALLVATGAVAAFVWSVRTGQLDDFDTPPCRMLLDDEPVDRANLAAAQLVDARPVSHRNRT